MKNRREVKEKEKNRKKIVAINMERNKKEEIGKK